MAPASRTTPYLPVIDLLWAYLRIDRRDDPRRIGEQVESRVVALDPGLRADG